jgi:Protein of unknown function (DUF3224)
VSAVARGTFEVDLVPGPAELDGTVARFDLVKTFHGDLDGEGRGVMLSLGDPGSGNAGYIAIETFSGRVGERAGSFSLQQFGTVSDGEAVLHYEIVPGSGSSGLEGISGVVRLTIEADGTHRYELEYEV